MTRSKPSNSKRQRNSKAQPVTVSGATRVVKQQPKPKRQWRLPVINWMAARRIALLFVVAAIVASTRELWLLTEPQLNQPVARIVVKGKLTSHNQQVLQQALQPMVNEKFLTVDLSAMQQRLEDIPWVASARISRIWPDQLQIEVAEHKAVARWGDEELLNIKAQAFPVLGMQGYENLPYLSGPKGTQEQVMQQYWNINQVLMPLGYGITRLEARERGSWFVTTKDGLQLLLGREQTMEKMRRFVTIYEKELKEQMSHVRSIDLRYANGLAVTWHQQAPMATVH